jgi:hypothetical protein
MKNVKSLEKEKYLEFKWLFTFYMTWTTYLVVLIDTFLPRNKRSKGIAYFETCT